MRYHLSWLTEKFDKGETETLSYIFFWGHTNKNARPIGEFVLSQWYKSPFVVNGVLYKTAAHWMMGRKALLFGDRETFEKILDAERPEDVRALSQHIRDFEEEKWIEWRYEIVKEGNFHKFTQNKKLRAYLLKTEDAVLVEANPVDEVWGIGLMPDSKFIKNPYAWNGLNLLGFALMEVREYLKHFSEFDFVDKESSIHRSTAAFIS